MNFENERNLVKAIEQISEAIKDLVEALIKKFLS